MTPNSAFSSNWPYMVNSDLTDHHILLHSAYDKNEMTRIAIPSSINRVVRTWITETKDIFLMGETDTRYELWSIDLDNFLGKKERANQIFQCYKVMGYDKDHVGGF
jgi:hypothetical protein